MTEQKKSKIMQKTLNKFIGKKSLPENKKTYDIIKTTVSLKENKNKKLSQVIAHLCKTNEHMKPIGYNPTQLRKNYGHYLMRHKKK